MHTPESRHLRWEKIARRILDLAYPHAAVEWYPELPPRSRSIIPAIVVEHGEAKVVDFQLYRSDYIPSDWVARALAQLDGAITEVAAKGGVLLMLARLLPEQARGYHTEHSIDILDLDAMRALAARDPAVLNALDQMATESGIALGVPGDPAALVPQSTTSPADRLAAVATAKLAGDPHKGANLHARLSAIPAGTVGSRDFEDMVLESLQYVFDMQLDGWRRQSRDEDGNRRAVCAKVVGAHSFWQQIVHDFRTRFIVFECKNYAEKITQTEILTTEKYLYLPALRGIAVVVSPKGVDDGAKRAMRGALRESGKLIVSLTVDELGTMLVARDRGAEVHETLAQRLDDFFLEITR